LDIAIVEQVLGNLVLRAIHVEQTLGQHQLDNANTYLGVRELLRDDESREEEELDLIPTHLCGIYTCK